MIQNLVLVGCGHMGFAMLEPWAKNSAAQKIWVVEPSPKALQGSSHKNVTLCANAAALPANLNPDVVVFAIRPQGLEEAIAPYKKFSGALFLTIAAGKKLETYGRVLGEVRLVRAMPNLAARAGAAAILLAADKDAKPEDKKTAEALFACLGKTFWLAREDLMDAATALSGCGPAYFYLLADVMAEAGRALGLAPDLARQLARQ
ncbi:MAG TPA: pyrroline-5-carboxylate reductase dimerization domain-containing protein, partial [Alphaproteobacteria bacterium]|nr:pyrroline-5-carboxylate reductase dimerization domain-containing protein [Alphaproteobacteria bacterium]